MLYAFVAAARSDKITITVVTIAIHCLCAHACDYKVNYLEGNQACTVLT